MYSPRTVFSHILVWSVGTLACISGSFALADFASLIELLPNGSNTLVMINAEKIYNSPIGLREGWKQQYQQNYGTSPLMMPPDAKLFVLGAELDLQYLQPNWEVAAIRMGTDLQMSAVAKLVNGQIDKINDTETVHTPRDATIVKFAPFEFGAMKPTRRQTVARWIRQAKVGNTTALSSYLKQAASYPEQVGTEIIMALDLTDALDRETVMLNLRDSTVLKDKNIDVEQAVDVLLTIRGVILGVRVTDKIHGSLRVDFTRDLSILGEVAKPLLLEILEDSGSSIDEFYDWKAGVKGNQFRIYGDLTASGMKRLFSFLELDATGVDDSEQKSKFPGDEEDKNKPDPYLTKQYYDGVQEYLRDLKRERGAKSYYTIGRWFDKYAGRIDRLPILGVDPDMVNYGAWVVSSLRDCVEAIKGSGIRSGARGATVSASGDYTLNTRGQYGNNGPPGVYSFYGRMPFNTNSSFNQVKGAVSEVEAQRRAIRKQERAASSTNVREIMRQVQEESSNIRRTMTEKYQMEF